MASDGDGLWEKFHDEVVFSEPSAGVIRAGRAIWTASFCVSCSKSSVWRGDSLVFPRVVAGAEAPHDMMSEAARELYLEAAAVLSISPRAAAALARATLEVELKALEVGGPRSKLDERIAALSGRVNVNTWKALTVLRDTGNSALHSSDKEGVVGLILSGEDVGLVPFLLSMTNRLVEELVGVPAKIDEVYDLLPPGVRAAAEEKAQKAQAG